MRPPEGPSEELRVPVDVYMPLSAKDWSYLQLQGFEPEEVG